MGKDKKEREQYKEMHLCAAIEYFNDDEEQAVYYRICMNVVPKKGQECGKPKHDWSGLYRLGRESMP